MAGVIPTEEFNAQLVSLVSRFGNLDLDSLTDEGAEPDEYTPPTKIGFLSEDLDASDDPKKAWDDQPNAMMDVWKEDVDGLMTITSPLEEVKVYSRRDTTVVEDTLVEVEFKRNRWQLIDANCAATTGLT